MAAKWLCLAAGLLIPEEERELILVLLHGQAPDVLSVTGAQLPWPTASHHLVSQSWPISRKSLAHMFSRRKTSGKKLLPNLLSPLQTYLTLHSYTDLNERSHGTLHNTSQKCSFSIPDLSHKGGLLLPASPIPPPSSAFWPDAISLLPCLHLHNHQGSDAQGKRCTCVQAEHGETLGERGNKPLCCFCYSNVCFQYPNVWQEIKQFTFVKHFCIPQMQEADGVFPLF